MKKFFRYFAYILILGIVFLIIWFGRYRFYTFVNTEHFDYMDPKPIEGYTDKQFYFQGETIKFYLRAISENNKMFIKKLISPNQFDTLKVVDFQKYDQILHNSQAELGCNWKKSYELLLDSSFTQGYYQVDLIDSMKNFNTITFIVGRKNNNGRIAILAPVTTWNAYNSWGGKSLYDNAIDKKNTYYVSTQRPVNTFTTKQDLQVEANTYLWMSKYYDVNLYPDYILEKEPKLLDNKRIIVLVYHCEYFSKPMFDKIEDLIKNGKSLLSIGANQMYWKIKWHKNFTQIECHKDLTFFDEGIEVGGLWKHNLRFKERVLGTRYTKPGIHTYAPYKVTNSGHWLYKELNVKNGDLFGLHGINELPISGSETSKRSILSPSNVELIAIGLNADIRPAETTIWNPKDPIWNCDGGAEFVIREISKSNAVLSTSSIQSGSGLGVDTVFSGIITNFVNKYYK
jgi:N,N-dimethylformamidase